MAKDQLGKAPKVISNALPESVRALEQLTAYGKGGLTYLTVLLAQLVYENFITLFYVVIRDPAWYNHNIDHVCLAPHFYYCCGLHETTKITISSIFNSD